MLSIFALPKPFRGHIGVIQNNAIRSWLALRPPCEIILFGDEDGTAETAARYGIRHIPEVDCNEYGTPLVNSLFNAAQELASHELMCYINADIILMSDFLPSVQQVPNQMFLLVGRRWDIDLNEPIDFNTGTWETNLRNYVQVSGTLHQPTGIDYFVFPRGMYRDIPAFAIARSAWDNWLVYRARILRIPVIDATKAINAVHQNHDYGHHPMGRKGIWRGVEAKYNRELLGGRKHSFNLLDATYILTPDTLKAARSARNIFRRLGILLETYTISIPLAEIVTGLLRLHTFSLSLVSKKPGLGWR